MNIHLFVVLIIFFTYILADIMYKYSTQSFSKRYCIGTKQAITCILVIYGIILII